MLNNNVIKDKIIESLKTVYYPNFKKNIIELGLVRDIKVENKIIEFSLNLLNDSYSLKDIMKTSCLLAIYNNISKDFNIKINISIISNDNLNNNSLSKFKNIIAIASGKGGVGKSTFSSNLSIVLSKVGYKVGLIDADIFGPSIPMIFNCSYESPQFIKINNKNYMIPINQYGIKLISIGFLIPLENAVVWRGPMATSAFRQFILDTLWGELDYLIIDLPPGTSDIHISLVQTLFITGVIIITTPQKLSILDARKGLEMFKQKKINIPVLGIIENQSYFSPEDMPDKKYYIFGSGGGNILSNENNVILLGNIPIIQSIREGSDDGYPVVMKKGKVFEIFKKLIFSLLRQINIVDNFS